MNRGKTVTKEKKVVWQDAVIAVALGTLIIVGILGVARTIWSGYHFLDDHELIRIEQSARQGQSLLTSKRQIIPRLANNRL